MLIELIFGAASAWAAFAPLYLYVSGIFDVNFMENIILFLIGPIVAVAVLYYIYDLSASQSRYKLLLNRFVKLFKYHHPHIIDVLLHSIEMQKLTRRKKPWSIKVLIMLSFQ